MERSAVGKHRQAVGIADALQARQMAITQQAKESNRGGKSCAAQHENDHEIGGIGRKQGRNRRGTNN